MIPSRSGRHAVDPCALGRVRWIFARWAGAWARAVEATCLLMHLQLMCYRCYYREYILSGEQQDYWIQKQGQGLHGALGAVRVYTSSRPGRQSCNSHRAPLSEARTSLRFLDIIAMTCTRSPREPHLHELSRDGRRRSSQTRTSNVGKLLVYERCRRRTRQVGVA